MNTDLWNSGETPMHTLMYFAELLASFKPKLMHAEYVSSFLFSINITLVEIPRKKEKN